MVYKLKLCRWSRLQVLAAFWLQTWRRISVARCGVGLVSIKTARCYIWRSLFYAKPAVQKLLNAVPVFAYATRILRSRYEGGNAEVARLITWYRVCSFLKPDMVSKNGASHDIELPQLWVVRCHVWHCSLTPCLASKQQCMFEYGKQLWNFDMNRLSLFSSSKKCTGFTRYK